MTEAISRARASNSWAVTVMFMQGDTLGQSTSNDIFLTTSMIAASGVSEA
jgi:hypothetical protein